MKKLIAAGCLGFAVYAVYHWSDALFHYGNAGSECLKFFEDTKTNPSLYPDPNDNKLFIVNQWIKDGNVVVQVGQKTKKNGVSGYYQSQLCVIGSSQMKIPGLLQEWQYR